MWKAYLVKSLWLSGLALLCLVGCKARKSTPSYSAVPCEQPLAQGIAGQVQWLEGNHMPSPGRPSPAPAGVQRLVRIYPLTKAQGLTQGQQPSFFAAPSQPPLLVLASQAGTGCFQAQLPAGSYSLLVEEKGELYANSFDGEGHIFPVQVLPGQVAQVQFRIDYAAAY